MLLWENCLKIQIQSFQKLRWQRQELITGTVFKDHHFESYQNKNSDFLFVISSASVVIFFRNSEILNNKLFR